MARPSKKGTKKKVKKETPLMIQYKGIKAKYPDAILLFRMGDFYETFGKDAIEAARVLGITLTKRRNGAAGDVELAGFPHHAVDMYLPRLVKAGFRVAICEQLEDPKKAKKLVKRGVTEIVTPGVALSEKMLDHKVNNYLAAVFLGKSTNGIAFVDVSTGEFLVAEGNTEYIDKLLQSLQPAEIIFAKNKLKDFEATFGNKFYTYLLEDWVFAYDFTREILLRHFQTTSLKGFGVENLKAGTIAAGAIIHYLAETEHPNLQHIATLSRIREGKYVWLDRFTIRNLELIDSSQESGVPLLKVLDKTISPMGGRLLRKWIVLPLRDKRLITQRLDVVDFLLQHSEMTEEMSQQIKLIGDIERLIARVPLGKINPRQVGQIRKALQAIEPIKKMCSESEHRPLQKIGEQLNLCQMIRDRIANELTENPPIAVGKGDVIAAGVSKELDELRHIMHSGKDLLEQMQQREIEKTGITSLKIGFNNVFGYFLEVRNRFKDNVPDTWLRKQTLVSSERYITEELKTYEEKIFGAEEKILALETEMFENLIVSLSEYIRPIQLNASLIARLDCLLSFTKNAFLHQYTKPTIDDSLSLDIKAGRHPVIEQRMALGEQYVANDVFLDSETEQLLIITGPNMSGKSAILRQTALIVLMAQMGSFVPATSATIGLVDKIFTRVGASDNISSGESTFMVEMNETASIMNNISPRSLILLDEIGRGTSTYDGISIAWALAEYLHNHPKASPKTLFATHYHELTELSNKFSRIKNYSIATKEIGNKVIFLRKLIAGSAEKSFGIHVAQMAGMPKPIIKRATEILVDLEAKNTSDDIKASLQGIAKADEDRFQLNIFDVTDPKIKKIKDALDALDVNTLTPLEALIKFNEFKRMLIEE